jgi:peptide/nickel transport system ATP-binding protein
MNGPDFTTRGGNQAERPILQIDDLHVAYLIQERWVDVVRGVSLSIRRGETYGLVGESGCGKSTSAFAVMGYLGRTGRITSGHIYFQGEDLCSKSPDEMRSLTGQHIGMVYQDPQSALNPALRVGKQIAEVVRTHDALEAADAWQRALAMLEKVHMPDPEAVMRRYPHQLSGGMQQRVLIAMALITNPELLIMDEPTTGLDVTTEATVLDLVNELKQTFDSAILYISHNLGVIARVCDQVGVMYAGQLVESGSVDEIFSQPGHPYTLDLLDCVPRLDRHYSGGGLRAIGGRVPPPIQLPPGCVYQPRCRFARDRCRLQEPGLLQDDGSSHTARCFFTQEVLRTQRGPRGDDAGNNGPVEETSATGLMSTESPGMQATEEPLLTVTDVKKYYGAGGKGLLHFGAPQRPVKAVDGIGFSMNEGETLSLVGESGCGKTTLGRCLVGLLMPTSGDITFRGVDASRPAAQRPVHLRQALQVVFQNPDSSLNPRYKVGQIISRPLRLFGLKDRRERRRRVIELLKAVRLDASYLERYPAQLSGGEKQRVAIARAFAGAPSLVVCDEAVSSLDVSVQASILNLLMDLKREQDCAYLFISHDLSVVRYISDRIGVMYLGQLMEIGAVDQIFTPPSHPYTEALLSAVPTPDPRARQESIRLEGSVPSPLDPPRGCPFHTRCPRKVGAICETTAPDWQNAGGGHGIYCHIELADLRAMQVAGSQDQLKGLPSSTETRQ